MMYKMKMSLTRKQIRQLAAEAEVDHRTVEKIYNKDGHAVSCWTPVYERVAAAAKKLKLESPPEREAK